MSVIAIFRQSSLELRNHSDDKSHFANFAGPTLAGSKAHRERCISVFALDFCEARELTRVKCVSLCRSKGASLAS